MRGIHAAYTAGDSSDLNLTRLEYCNILRGRRGESIGRSDKAVHPEGHLLISQPPLKAMFGGDEEGR
jgi:hypothetical protein